MDIRRSRIYRTLIMVLLWTPNIAVGQEFIKRISLRSDLSIVREVSGKEWLVCSYDKNNNRSTFVVVRETDTTAQVLDLPLKYIVNDFEIYNDTVFFCGQVDTIENSVAIFGYFRYSPSFANPVYCCHIAEAVKFDKLELYENNNKPHVVFTGKKDYKYGLLADAIKSAPNSWDFATAFNMSGDNIIYDDVAIIKDYIIVTSRSIISDSGMINYFLKPSTYSTMFPNSIYGKIQYQPKSKILVTECSNNTFATLCMNSNSTYVMSRYNLIINSVSLQSGSPFYGVCQDISYNKDSNSVEVLINDCQGDFSGSCILLHYSQSLPSFGISIPIHLYHPYIMYSIDYLKYNPLCFVASGSGAIGYYEGILRVFRYKYNEWHGCLNIKLIIPADKIENKLEFFEYGYQPMLDTKEAVLLDCSKNMIEVEMECEE